jgi:hypothetical protein
MPIIDEPIPVMVGGGLVMVGGGLITVGDGLTVVGGGLEVTDTEDPPMVMEVELELGGDAGGKVNDREMVIPAGTCETLTGETIGAVEPSRSCIIEIARVAPPPADPVATFAGADDSPPTLTLMETAAGVPCWAMASAVKSLRRALTLIPPRISWTNRVNWALVGLVWRIDSNRLVTSLPAAVWAMLVDTSAA